MDKRIAIGMLCFSRPLHTALTIAFALRNKSDISDFFAFYGIHKSQPVPNQCLDGMLKELYSSCGLQFFYMNDDKPRNVQGNVDTLMSTLSSLPGYRCFIKIDDDVLIGKQTDVTMSNILLALEPERCHMLMAQAVPEHMRRHNPFCWEAMVNGYRVVQRAQRACPMETYTAVSKRCLEFLRENNMQMSCENARGTYGPFTRKIVNAGGKVCLVLSPAITMQHIGLTTTIEVGNPARSWAPARSWEPMDQVIDVPGFDFNAWETSHKSAEAQKKFTLNTIEALVPSVQSKYTECLDILLKWIDKYSVSEPAPVPMAKPLLASAARPTPAAVTRTPGLVLRKLEDGRVVRSPGQVRRVVIRQTT